MNDVNKNFRGLIHIHTTHSFDGTLTLPAMASLAKTKGYDFIALTEHAEDFDDKKMQVVADECAGATCGTFLVIPGLEFNINNEVHILGIGISRNIHEKNPEELIRKIHENHGLAVLAHTAEYRTAIPYTKLKDIDLIEIWNPRYGEKISPSIKSIKILREFRKMTKTYFASGGLDLHNLRDLVPLYLIVSSDQLSQEAIISALTRGAFTTSNGFIDIPALQEPSFSKAVVIHLFAVIQLIPNISKKVIKLIKKNLKQHQKNF